MVKSTSSFKCRRSGPCEYVYKILETQPNPQGKTGKVYQAACKCGWEDFFFAGSPCYWSFEHNSYYSYLHRHRDVPVDDAWQLVKQKYINVSM